MPKSTKRTKHFFGTVVRIYSVPRALDGGRAHKTYLLDNGKSLTIWYEIYDKRPNIRRGDRVLVQFQPPHNSLHSLVTYWKDNKTTSSFELDPLNIFIPPINDNERVNQQIRVCRAINATRSFIRHAHNTGS